MRDRRRHGHHSRDRWLLSYADFITLLFAFFTTMYAISTVDAGKLSTMAQGLQQAFDPNEQGRGVNATRGDGVLSDGVSLLSSEQLDAKTVLVRDLADDLASGRLEMSEDGRGLVVSIPEASSFPTGSADLSEGAQAAMIRLAGSLQKTANALRIEGHTDDVPIHSARFASNWELSTARATAVVQWLIERGQMPPQRLSAAGYGEYHPRVPNDSAEARGRNRRVDVVILKGPQP